MQKTSIFCFMFLTQNDYLAMEPNKDKAEEFNAVCTLTFSNDSEYIAGGDTAGYIKVWRVANKALKRRMRCAIDSGVTSLQFSRDGVRIVSGCFDNIVRIHSLETGTVLKEFRGHTSFVNDVCFTPDNHSVVSASSDGTVRVWNVRSRECTAAISTARTNPVPCNRVMVNPLSADQIIISDRSNTVTVTTLKGQVVRSYATTNEKDQFVDLAASSRCQWLYAVATDGTLFCFNTATGKIDNKLKVNDEGEILGLAAHPFKNMIAVYADAGQVTLWEA